jgi:Tfp pilus assembly protein PilF
MSRSLAAALIVMAGLAAYVRSDSGVFVFDDRASIVDNPNVRTPEPWATPLTAMQAPRNTTLAGRPVASLTFALNYALAPIDARNTFDPPSAGSLASPELFRRNVWGYHATNLLIHLVAALALFGIVRRTLETPALRAFTGTAATPLAFIVALAWTVHPLQTGSVTYLVQRVESLMGMFLLLTLYASIRAAEVPAKLKLGPTTTSDPAKLKLGAMSDQYVGPSFSLARTSWSVAALVACALGMGTKEVMVVAPLIVIAWDWTFLSGSVLEIARRRWPLHVGLMATWIIVGTLVAMDPRPLSAGFGFVEWPWWRYLVTQAGVITHYLRLSLWPSPLVLDYSWPAATNARDILLPGLCISVLALGTLWSLARRRPLGFVGAWFFLILAPSSSILPIITEVAAEHRMYLPLAAVLSLIVVGGFAAVKRAGSTPMARAVAFVSAFAIIATYAWQTNARNADYESEARLWADTVQKQPHNARARNNYGAHLLATGQLKAAAEQLRVAVQESPTFAEAHARLGRALALQGQTADALPHLERALEINPFYTAAYQDIAEAYRAERQLTQAVKYFLKALDQQPDDVMMLNTTAWILATSADDRVRDARQASVLAQHAVDITRRDDASSLDSLAAAFAEAGRFDDAAATISEALRLARARGDRQFPVELEQRLALYRAGKAFRQ